MDQVRRRRVLFSETLGGVAKRIPGRSVGEPMNSIAAATYDAACDSRETLAEPKSKRVKTEPGARDHAQSVDAAPDAPPPEMPIIGSAGAGAIAAQDRWRAIIGVISARCRPARAARPRPARVSSGGRRKRRYRMHGGAPESGAPRSNKTPQSAGGARALPRGSAKTDRKADWRRPAGAPPGSQVLAPLALSGSAWLRAKSDTGSVRRRADKFDAGCLQGRLYIKER